MRSGGGQPVPVADPDHAVEPPGPLEDRLFRPDMLIFDTERLSDDVVEEIRAIPQVAAAEVIGLGQVLIENRGLRIAAVDGATYRRFTPDGTAQTQAVWDRVAGGELAIDPELGKRLQDKDGNITLGSGEDAPVLHVGAYAPQAEQIDMVVNTAWVEDLQNMEFGNGLLISTDSDDPSTIRKEVNRIVGQTASVQDLDIASRIGLDPNVQQTAFLTGGSIADVVGTFNYTVLGGGRIAPDPSWVPANIAHRGGADPRHGDLPPGDLPAAARGAGGHRLRAAWPTRSTPASTPAATTRASSPAPPRCPTTPSASRSTSTCPATSAARSARWTGGGGDLQGVGLRLGRRLGATPTRCTSRWRSWSTRADGWIAGRERPCRRWLVHRWSVGNGGGPTLVGRWRCRRWLVHRSSAGIGGGPTAGGRSCRRWLVHRGGGGSVGVAVAARGHGSALNGGGPTADR